MLSPAGPQQQEADARHAAHLAADARGDGRRRPWLVRIVWLLLLAAATGAIVFFLRPAEDARTAGAPFGPRSGQPAAMPVGAAAVARSDIPVTVQALGTVTPLATVVARTRVAGQITRVAFTEGQQVEKGDLLAEVDARPYQIALDQARSQLARDEAELANARTDLARYQALARQNAIARQQLDAQQATVRQLEATVKASAAAVRTAELNLEYTRTTAPIAGRAGLRQIDEGNYAQTGDAGGLVTITQMRPISVLFSVPEDQAPAINRRLAGGEALPVALYDRNRTGKLAEGRLSTIDNQIDTTTGTVRLRAVFDNADEALFPNQFVNVELRVDTVRDAVVIPATARLTGRPGTYTWLIDRENRTVAIRPVATGFSTADLVQVLDGLQPGDLVVTDGSDRLREGMQVALPGERPAAPAAAPATARTRQGGPGPRGSGPGNSGEERPRRGPPGPPPQ
ncbi:MAG: MdtA/MuxA family multidrug efflux RND transporter periplasmic adaptor subunit [Pseudochelatococcus sp.]|jgi:multidrug efflux system membrane fusion protein|uniref:MdtA/MuxA family multidrug efflux RND transporter periplasmic adaptor subunit n=1 Tax=Pseudochelatococcus sp. TaxID=2020869 RepID=UPI003D94C4A1